MKKRSSLPLPLALLLLAFSPITAASATRGALNPDASSVAGVNALY